MVTIVISYKKGTGNILAVNLASLARHTKDVPHKIDIITAKGDMDRDLIELNSYYRINMCELNICNSIDNINKMHGMMLDAHIPSAIDSEFILTLDSDCFPVADGWLSDLLNMNADIAGILHPWVPPPDMNKNRIEWRVRSQHCWANTHVACQIMKTSKFKELGMKYNAGDDTGLAITKAAMDRAWKIDGYKLTRCPKPLEVVPGTTDPEFNRYVCLIYGDKMYHHGGWTRTNVGTDKPVLEDEFGWVTERVLTERGAEWLLDDDLSYKFKFDKEEEVAKEKMGRLFGLKNAK